ncbi:MAG TPA: hypothetical protein ENH65_06770 [Candidatus Aminicenantes bacterium]|nr:hypothetical protein [Candidatus Aminicenantes bacterium]
MFPNKLIGAPLAWNSRSLLGSKLMFDYHIIVADKRSQNLGGANVSIVVDASGGQKYGANSLAGLGIWTNYTSTYNTFESTGPDNVHGIETNAAERAKCHSPAFSATNEVLYEVDGFLNIKDGITQNLEMYLVSGPSSNAAKSNKIRWTAKRSGYFREFLYCIATDATTYLAVQQSTTNGLVNFSIDHLRIRPWTSGYFTHAITSSEKPSTFTDIALKVDEVEEFMRMDNFVADFVALEKGCLIVQYNNPNNEALDQYFLGVGNSASDNDSIIMQQSSGGTAGIYKNVGGVAQNTTYTNTDKLANQVMILETNGNDGGSCRINGVDKTEAGSTNYDFFDLVSGVADEVLLFGKKPQLTNVYGDMEVKRMMFCTDLVPMHEKLFLESHLI